MASYDRQFDIVRPSMDRLIRAPLEANDPQLLNPQSTSPVPLIPGELVQINSSYKYIRAVNATEPSFFCIEDRGDYGVQASRKMSAIMGGTFEADTIVFDTALTTIGVAVKWGSVNNSLSGSVARAGLVAQGGTGIILAYITRVAATNGGRLRVLQMFV
jgi:hypothetical protein